METNNVKTDIYKNSCEMMYKMISQRIYCKRKQLKLRNRDIYEDDENLICAIIHNRRDPKKNKYLIPAETSRSENPKNYVFQITSNLKFNSSNELLWGNGREIMAYSGELFYTLINDAIACEPKKVVDEIYNVLTDYIPFALSKFYCDLSEEFPSESADLIGKKYYSDEEKFNSEKQNAIVRIYQKIDASFIDKITDFLYKRENTLKLDKAFSSFVTTELLPLMQNELDENSLGVEVKNILSQNYQRFFELFNHELQSSPEALGYHENDHLHYEREIIGERLQAVDEYVKSLSLIQEKHEKPIHLKSIKSNWEKEMCSEDQK